MSKPGIHSRKHKITFFNNWCVIRNIYRFEFIAICEPYLTFCHLWAVPQYIVAARWPQKSISMNILLCNLQFSGIITLSTINLSKRETQKGYIFHCAIRKEYDLQLKYEISIQDIGIGSYSIFLKKSLLKSFCTSKFNNVLPIVNASFKIAPQVFLNIILFFGYYLCSFLAVFYS